MNALDKLIAVFSPKAGLKRAAARAAFDQFRKYDGASQGRRTAGWRAPSTSAQNEVSNAAQILRNRSREQVRNNPWANKAINVIVSNAVGHGIRGKILSRSRSRSANVQEFWNSWAESTQCDASGRHNLYGLQQLVMRTVAESGECLIIKEIISSQKIPIALRVIEPDHIDTSKDAFQVNGNRVVDGIEFNPDGKPVAYYIFPDHPGDRVQFRDNYRDSQRIPVDRVAHVFKQERPGQIRGVPWGASIMLRLKDLDDYEDAQLVRQKIAACFTAFVTDIDGSATTGQQTAISDRIEPGAIEILPPGRSIQMATPPVTTGYSEYMKTMLHSIASGYGITYESLTGDLSQVNFSSARMGWIEFQRNIDSWRWMMLIPQMLDPVFAWFQQGLQINGVENINLSIYWTAPRREMIDPGKEIAAIRDAIRCGVCSLSEAQRMLGFDPTKLLTEYKADFDELDKLGLVFDCDPRKTTQQGQAQSLEPTDTATPEEQEADRALTQALVEISKGIAVGNSE